MSRKTTEADSLANASLSTSRVHPQKGVAQDSMPSSRNLPGNDHQKGLDAMAEKKKVGSKPDSVPSPAKGGSNARGSGQTESPKEGKGGQKLQQKKK